MQFEARLERSGEMTSKDHIYINDGIACSQYKMLLGALEYMGFLVRCAGQDEFLQPNVTISYQQHSVWMQELDVG
jgi:hypothetical protein